MPAPTRAAPLQRREQGRAARRPRPCASDRKARDQDVEVAGSRPAARATDPQLRLDPRCATPASTASPSVRRSLRSRRTATRTWWMSLRIAEPRERVVVDAAAAGRRQSRRARASAMRRRRPRTGAGAMSAARSRVTRGPARPWGSAPRRSRPARAAGRRVRAGRRRRAGRLQLELAEAGHDPAALDDRDLVVGQLGHRLLVSGQQDASRRRRVRSVATATNGCPARVGGDERREPRAGGSRCRSVELDLVRAP